MAGCFICALVLLLNCVQSVASDLNYSMYARVLEVDTCRHSILVDELPSVQPGDQIVVHQAQVANDEDLESAGLWSIQDVEAIAGNELFLRGAHLRSFDLHGTLQIAKVISGDFVSIDTALVPEFRSGIGGILVVQADTFEVGRLSAIGAGFAGGKMSLAGWDTSHIADTDSRPDQSGQVGQSFVRQTNPRFHQRHNNHTGGGGGNARNAGGGGGGHVSAGGQGGDQTNEFPPAVIGGFPGSTVTALKRAMFGGGGGGGHQNDFLGSEGGRGGGAIIVLCSVLKCIGESRIDVSGQTPLLAIVDGAGGGGAAGTVLLSADTVVGNLSIIALGGEGGTVIGRWRCYGPGGGGSGGSIQSNVNVQTLVEGGRAGRSLSQQPCDSDSSFGSANGGDGFITEFNNVPTQLAIPCDGQIIEVCVRDTSGSPGEHVGIAVDLITPRGLDRKALVELKIQTRATVLLPIGAFWWAGIRETSRYLRRSLEPGPPSTLTLSIPYQVALGDSQSVQVKVDSAWSDDAEVEVVHHGRFTVLDVCESESRSRLFEQGALQGTLPETYNTRGQRVSSPLPPMIFKKSTSSGSGGSVLLVPR